MEEETETTCRGERHLDNIVEVSRKAVRIEDNAKGSLRGSYN